jgi:hypothetical protein
VRATIDGSAQPEIEAIECHLCEDDATAMLYAHLSNDDATGGLPLVASFDLPPGIPAAEFDGAAYVKRFDADVDDVVGKIERVLRATLVEALKIALGDTVHGKDG